MEQELERLEGTVEDIIYLNEDNGYTVFEVSGGGVVTVVCGVVGELHAGESVVCRGRYENHATYGRQFHAQECETDMPKDLEAVYAFLASRSLPYIGARTADKIIDKFGAAALEVIANDPAQLTLIPGISADKADRIQQEFKRMFGMRELIAYLAQFEISPRRAMEVFRTFGPGAMQAIQQNPYLLCGEPLQLDFRHADSIAQYYQMAGDCTQRLEAALLRTLRHNAGNGHTCLPRAQLLETASNFIHQPPEKLAAALDSCIQTGKLAVRMFDGTPYIYLPDLLAAEQDIADRLAMLTKRGKQTAHGLDKNIQILELAQGFAYAPLQKEAIRKAMTENCLVLTGGPGTGKTTTVNAILQLLENEAERVALCAPTGRAAKRLSELTGRKASTIHRLLEVDYTGGVVSFIHNDKNLLKCDVVILDEMSMVDVKLFQALIAALRYSCRIIMVGDADQLPSVGPGNILGETIRSGLVPTVCLNEIFRQAAQSLIVENAHHIISGEPLKKGGKTDDFFFLEADGDAAQKLVCDLVTTRLPRSYQFDPVKDIQVLCPTKLGPTGLKKLLAKLLKTDSNRKVTQEELLMFVDEVEQGGSINENEGSLLRSAIEFNDVQVEDILTHRVDIEAVDVDESKDEIAKIFTESGHSRLPVYKETIDDIIGIVHHKDFYTDGGITEHSVREIMTKPIFIPPTLKISNLLKLLQKEKTYMAVVTDEYGGTLGIVTMEDILEELVGEIWDEHDEIVENVRKLGENNYDINCAMDLDEFFDMFDITDETDSSTLNGWVMEHLGRIPDIGDKFSAYGLEITIKAADGRRVNEINVVHTPAQPEKDTK